MRLAYRPEDLPDTGDVLIFGAGDGGRIVWSQLAGRRGLSILGFLDNHRTGRLNGLPIHAPADRLPAPGVTVVIASMYAREIAEQLRTLGVTDWVNAAPLLINQIQARQLRRRGTGIVSGLLELPMLFIALAMALVGRFRHKPVDVGIGADCIINNRYHKLALLEVGYSAETFVNGVTHVTNDFDHVFFSKRYAYANLLTQLRIFYLVVTRYRILYTYFNGCPFVTTTWLWRFEPVLLSIARVRTVVMPYGQDLQDFTRCRNLPFKHATATDYPFQSRRRARISQRIDLWTRRADHIIGGCDWVDYLYHWDSLLLAHFAIDTEALAGRDAVPPRRDGRIRIVHAPNHRRIKGTRHFIEAVEQLQREGLPVDLIIVEGASNRTVLDQIATADIVFDQLLVGWYAMVAIEAMALGKPVVCFIRPDLLDLYQTAGLLQPDELPLISATPETLVDQVRALVSNPDTLPVIGARGREFVRRHHSLRRIGQAFDAINRSLGVWPARVGPSSEP